MGDRLFVFTKNWGDLKSSVYSISKLPGNYEVEKLDTYDVDGLITGAVFNKVKNEIILTGYKSFFPFIVKLTDFSENNPFDGIVKRFNISVPGSVQVEGISVNSDGSYTLSSESSAGLPASIYRLNIE